MEDTIVVNFVTDNIYVPNIIKSDSRLANDCFQVYHNDVAEISDFKVKIFSRHFPKRKTHNNRSFIVERLKS